jgi:hypothetical protein
VPLERHQSPLERTQQQQQQKQQQQRQTKLCREMKVEIHGFFVESWFNTGWGNVQMNVHEIDAFAQFREFPFKQAKGVHGRLKGGKRIAINVGIWVMNPEPDAIVNVSAVEC